MEKIYSLVGERIRRYRKEKKLSQLEMSNSCSISRASLSNIESGKQRITLDLLYKFADKLDVRIYDLLPASPDSEIDFLSSKRVIDSPELLDIINQAKKGNEE